MSDFLWWLGCTESSMKLESWRCWLQCVGFITLTASRAVSVKQSSDVYPSVCLCQKETHRCEFPFGKDRRMDKYQTTASHLPLWMQSE